MPAGKSPAFSMYPKDFLTDTQLLSAEQLGAYIALLCNAWVGLPGNPQGFLPPDGESLARLARLTPKRWREIGTPVLELFEQDGEGRLYHKRLLRELARQKDRSKKASASAKRRWGGANGMRTHSERTAKKAGATEDANAGKRGRGQGKGGRLDAGQQPPRVDDFERLWDVYPNKQRRRRAEAAWSDVYEEAPPIDDLVDAVKLWRRTEQWTAEGGRYVPLLHKWLREQRWLEPPVISGPHFDQIPQEEIRAVFGRLEESLDWRNA